MTRPRTTAQRKQDERDRMRGAGFILRQFWIHPNDWPRAQKYLATMRKKRESAKGEGGGE